MSGALASRPVTVRRALGVAATKAHGLCPVGPTTKNLAHNSFPIALKHPGCFGAAGVLWSGGY
jgi:hypothetical protein